MTMNVILDGPLIGRAQLFSNGASTHRALPTLFLGVPLTYGPHSLQLSIASAPTTSDQNDFFFAAILY